jgi:hypothetical protein
MGASAGGAGFDCKIEIPLHVMVPSLGSEVGRAIVRNSTERGDRTSGMT